MQRIASAIRLAPESSIETVQAAIETAVPQAHYRAIAKDLVATWKIHAPALSGHSLAFGLTSAAKYEEFVRATQRLDLVWTGPDVEAIPPVGPIRPCSR